MMFTERNVGLPLITVACLLVMHCETSCIGKTLLRSGGISCEEKQIILDEHNRLRQLVALGQIHGQPGAANMMEMIWDDELAAIAQRWADRCAESHDGLRNVRSHSYKSYYVDFIEYLVIHVALQTAVAT